MTRSIAKRARCWLAQRLSALATTGTGLRPPLTVVELFTSQGWFVLARRPMPI